jgi:hypothetical protein
MPSRTAELPCHMDFIENSGVTELETICFRISVHSNIYPNADFGANHCP